MKWRVIRSEVLKTGVNQIDQYLGIAVSELYPKPGELFKGTVQTDENGNKTVCGQKTTMTITYPFCFSRANVQPVIAGIPINAVTLIAGGVGVLLLVKALKK